MVSESTLPLQLVRVTYRNLCSLNTQGRVDSVYFDFSSAFGIGLHVLLIYKHGNFGLSSS
jgi:hypothetical protein